MFESGSPQALVDWLGESRRRHDQKYEQTTGHLVPPCLTASEHRLLSDENRCQRFHKTRQRAPLSWFWQDRQSNVLAVQPMLFTGRGRWLSALQRSLSERWERQHAWMYHNRQCLHMGSFG